MRALRHACGPADQCFGARRAGDRDEDAFPRLPRLGDPVPLAVLPERVVDLVGDPQQRELAQRGEVARSEVVGERGVDPSPACRCCRGPCAGAAPPASCRRARPASACRTTASGIVSRCLTPVMRSTTSLSDSRCWMLSVEMTSMPAASSSSTSCQRFALREPGTLVWASSSTSACAGLRARMASTSISSNVAAAVLDRPARDRPRGRRSAPRSAGARASRRSRRRRPCRARSRGDPR